MMAFLVGENNSFLDDFSYKDQTYMWRERELTPLECRHAGHVHWEILTLVQRRPIQTVLRVMEGPRSHVFFTLQCLEVEV